MRFQRAAGAERPGGGTPASGGTPALGGGTPAPQLQQRHGSDAWDPRELREASGTGDNRVISAQDTYASQAARLARPSGVKGAILRRHSDEESSFRRFVKSKKELFPDGVASKDSSFSDRGSCVDLNDSVQNVIEEGHLYRTVSPSGVSPHK